MYWKYASKVYLKHTSSILLKAYFKYTPSVLQVYFKYTCTVLHKYVSIILHEKIMVPF